jgi:hypothetical protein
MRTPNERHETATGRRELQHTGDAMSQRGSAMADDISPPPGLRELAYRVHGGVEVTLLWDARENRVAVTVSDMRTGEWFVLHVENDQALEAFYHPYAYATLEAAA